MVIEQAGQRGELAGAAGEREVRVLRGSGEDGCNSLLSSIPFAFRSGFWMFVKSQDSLGSAGAEEEGKESLHCLQGERDREGISFLRVLPAGLLIVLVLLCRAA